MRFRFPVLAAALLALAPAALASAALASAALANESVYTKLSGPAAHCAELESQPDEGGWYLERCTGHAGIAVFVGEGDLRTMVSYGMNARAEKAASETFPAFNTIGETLEWRLKDGKPFATILRWKIDGGPDMPKGEMLVVTQLDEGNQCWVAVIAAHKNKDANELARKAADEMAGTVTCGDDYRAKSVGTPDPAIWEE
ncbi:MAG: hypothetical protein IT548_09645 [Alphaproteobacteria bacterium]|nr:hypothetical protein [Alphaproteobacteria bacterium]